MTLKYTDSDLSEIATNISRTLRDLGHAGGDGIVIAAGEPMISGKQYVYDALSAAGAKGAEEMRAAIIDDMEKESARLTAEWPWDETPLFLKSSIRRIRALGAPPEAGVNRQNVPAAVDAQATAAAPCQIDGCQYTAALAKGREEAAQIADRIAAKKRASREGARRGGTLDHSYWLWAEQAAAEVATAIRALSPSSPGEPPPSAPAGWAGPPHRLQRLEATEKELRAQRESRVRGEMTIGTDRDEAEYRAQRSPGENVMNAVERVALVLHAEDSDDHWEEATSYAKAMHRRAARAAIATHKQALAAAGFVIVAHERSEGEQTERPGAVDPLDDQIKEFVEKWDAFCKTPDGKAFYRIVEAARQEGLRAGREEMRERAARLAEQTFYAWANGIIGEKETNGLPSDIRSLPLQAEGEDTPHG